MTGFLRRIARGVTEGGPRVHPFVESSHSFVPAETGGSRALVPEVPTFAREEEEASAQTRSELGVADASARHPPSRSIVPGARQRLPAAAGERPPLPHVENESPPTTIEGLAFRPLLPPPTTAPSAGWSGEPRTLESRPRAGDADATPPDLAPGGSRSSSPLVPADGDARREPDASGGTAAPHAVREAARGLRSPRPAPRSDEIQITIGRIEVVALPPAAPRAVAAPTRKGIRLDDYLRRKSTTGGSG